MSATTRPTSSDPRDRGDVMGRPRSLASLFKGRIELLLTPLVLVALLGSWHLITAVFEVISPIILPSPRAVGRSIIDLYTAPWFPQHLYATTVQAVLGFLIAAFTATSAAVIMDQVPLIRRVVYPYVVVFQVMPAIVLAPIFIIWFGFGMESKIVVAAATAFFVIVVNTLAGLASVPENSHLLMRSLVSSRSQIFFKLSLPTALPFVFAAFKTAITLALIGSLVGEFITARAGLGRLMTQFSFSLRQDMMFATVVTVGVLGVTLYGIVSFLERKVVWWRH